MRTLHTLSRRPLCRGIGLVRFIAMPGLLAAGLSWALPALDQAAVSMKLSTASNVLLDQLASARAHVQRSGGRIAACRSDDGVACSPQGGWEQGWILFEDANGDGVRGSGEGVLERVAALPGEFRLQGSLATGVFTLCSRDAGPGDARQISLHGGLGPHVRKVRVSSCV
ncbi:GspH/FimT family protein [Ramlibacter albus]|uniref:Type II secretion system protein H n=1 Tax=Ramlibacter albus TaxID=2079448 RepID=A0A923MF15_9BURK|nr:GspH/FimT family pseudopilin [Ramlibacter albus]MBC5768249.1 GspH/FimT family pseudopilin [Ramlibacter albus]